MENQLQTLSKVDRDGNIEALKQAIEADDIEGISSLIECGVDLNHRNKAGLLAIDLPWAAGTHYDSVLKLLQLDSEYPQGFSLELLEGDDDIPENLIEWIDNIEVLHDWIKNDEFHHISNFVTQRPISRFLNYKNQPALMTAAAECKNVKTFEILTGDQNSVYITPFTKELLLKQINQKGDTLLCISARNGKKNIVEFLITYGIEVNHCNNDLKRAVDLAWENEHYDIVQRLLEADSEFPKGFDLKYLKEGSSEKELEKFVAKRNDLHDILIKEENLKEIKEYMMSNKSKFYLNSVGQSALLTAIQNRKFHSYALLKSFGVVFKDDSEQESMDNLRLSEGDKHNLQHIMVTNFPITKKQHIFYLISKSRAITDIDKFTETLKDWYEKLDSYPEISIIMRVVQYADYLDIIFDFKSDNIQDINPTASKTTKGTTDYKDGRLYISHKRNDNRNDNKLLGTLAHELTHFAMYLVYKNNCNPFNSLNNDKMQEFKDIMVKLEKYTKDVVKQIERKSNIDDSPIVTLARAFRYPKNEIPSEIIVRIPHILVQYEELGKTWLLRNEQVKRLYNYYIDKEKDGLMYDCKKFISHIFDIKPRSIIQTFNDIEGEIKNITKYGIDFVTPIDLDKFLGQKQQVWLLRTESTLLSSISIYQSLMNKGYSSQDSLFFTFCSYVEQQTEINKAFYSFAGKVLCIRGPYEPKSDQDKQKIKNVLKALNELLQQKSDKKIIFIMCDKIREWDKDKILLSKTYTEESKSHKYTLNDLTQTSQEKIFRTEIEFQGGKITLNKLICVQDEEDKQIINAEIIEKLIKNEEIKIGRDITRISHLAGCYSQLYEDVDGKSLINSLLSNDDNIFVICGIKGAKKQESFISKLESFKTGLEVKNIQPNQTRILLNDDKFQEKNFRQLCKDNPDKKIYLIFLKDEDVGNKTPSFVLQQIYYPDFYILREFNYFKKVIITDLCEESVADSIYKILQEGKDIFLFTGDDLGGGKNVSDLLPPCMIDHSRVLLEDNINGQFVFDNLVKQNKLQSIHWLKIEHRQIVWIKSYGGLDNLRKFINRKKSIKKSSDEGLINDIKDNKVVIFADDAGMGKTTSLTTLCLEFTETFMFQSHWIICVDLKDHISTISSIKSPNIEIDDIINLCLEATPNLNEPFTKQMLSFAFKNPKFFKPILIKFDGFDDVLDQDIREKIISIIQCLKHDPNANNVKFWITCRLHYKHTLENALSSFAIKFEPLDKSQKEEYTYKFLKNRLHLTLSPTQFHSTFGDDVAMVYDETSLISKFIEEFLNKLQDIFQGESTKFIGTPLQLYLLLEGSTEYFKKLIENNLYYDDTRLNFDYLGDDMLSVYEKFINDKYNIYLQKIDVKSELLQKRLKASFNQDHQNFAETLIFNSKHKKTLKEFQDIMLSVGIIKSHGNNSKFIHPSFRDYFVAQVFVHWIEESIDKLPNVNKQTYVLKEIFIKEDYQLIRLFINLKLKKFIIKEAIIKKFGEIINTLQDDDLIIKIFDTGIRECNKHILQFISSSITSVDKQALYKLCYCFPSKITERTVEEKLEQEKKLCYTSTRHVVLRHIVTKHIILRKSGKATHCVVLRRTAINYTVQHHTSKGCILQCNYITHKKNRFRTTRCNVILYRTTTLHKVKRHIIPHCAIPHCTKPCHVNGADLYACEEGTSILQFYCDTMMDRELYSSSMALNYDKRIKVILDIIQDNLSRTEVYKILSKQSEEGTVLHNIIWLNDNEIQEDATDSLICLRNILLLDVKQATIENNKWQLAIDCPLIRCNSEKLILNTVKEIFSPEQIFEFLCNQDNDKQTILHMAVRSNNYLMQKLMIDSMRKQAEDQIADNFLHQRYIETDDHYVTITKLLLCIAEEILSSDQVFELLCKQDREGKTVLHIAFAQNEFHILSILDLLLDLSTDKAEQWISIYNDALEHHYNSDTILHLILDTAEKKLSRDQMHKFLSIQDKEGAFMLEYES